MKPRGCVRFLDALLLLFAVGSPAYSQAPPSLLVTKPIDGATLVMLRGDVHPLAQARYDVGAAPSSMPAKRLMLLLNRPAGREAALAQYMQDVHTPGSATHHQ